MEAAAQLAGWQKNREFAGCRIEWSRLRSGFTWPSSRTFGTRINHNSAANSSYEVSAAGVQAPYSKDTNCNFIKMNASRIIQAGMGVGISTWQLARTVSQLGQRGTVSGVAAEIITAIVLQQGDPGGHFRRALQHFPFPKFAQKVLDEYFVEGGTPGKPKNAPLFSVKPDDKLINLTICANFCIVWLAKEGHNNPISINYLEKIALPHVYALTGALLARVDAVTMGAGIPFRIPKLLDDLVAGNTATYGVPVEGGDDYEMSFHPETFFGAKLPELKRPLFLPIISSYVLGLFLKQRLPKGSIQELVIEEPSAGGHNAPPRKIVRDDNGRPLPIYGKKDEVNYEQIASLGFPFWIAGSRAHPESLARALELGAQGCQVGTAFALCKESGMDPLLKKQLLRKGFARKQQVRTDMLFSPTDFPFKVALLDGTLSDPDIYNARTRICDRRVLARLYKNDHGAIGYRCPSEPVHDYVRKGGKVEDTALRGCICNGLLATAGYNTDDEPPVVTLGDDLGFLPKIMQHPDDEYDAARVIDYLLPRSATHNSF